MNTRFLVKFLKFGIIGGVVFLFDAFCFWLLLKLFQQPALARGLSVALAITLSWLLNRHFTFHTSVDQRNWKELLRFAVSQLPGACANALVSVIAFQHVPYAQNNPWLSVGCGSAAGLIFNFLIANFFVFNSTKKPS